MFHWTWFCILKLKIMKTILKLEVHRHQAFPQNLRLTRRHVDAQLGTLRSGDISLLYIHRWLGHNALESQAAALSEEGMLWVAKLIQHPPGALFIEDKSWAYSSTGSFCINWGNLSEGCYLLDVCRLTEVAGFSVRAAVKPAAGKCTAAALAPRSQFCNSSLTGLWSKGYCSSDLHVAFVCLGFSSYCMRLVLLLLCLLIFCSTLQPSFLCFAISCLFLFSC